MLRRSHTLRALGCVCTVVAAAPGQVGHARSQAAGAAAESTFRTILGLFTTHPIVALGMDHSQQDEMDFAIALLSSAGFADQVDAVAVECANRLYQSTLDRYVAGDSVPFSEISKVWRNTTQIGRCDTHFEERIFAAIRAVNRGRLAERRLRALAVDPPIDWASVAAPADFARYLTARDTSVASVLRREVLARHRRALIVIGSGHVLRRTPVWNDRGDETVRQMVDRIQPGAMFVITPHQGFGARTAAMEQRMVRWGRPHLALLAAEWPGDVPAGLVYTGAIMPLGQDPRHPPDPYPGATLADLADGFLYLGPLASLRRVAAAVYSPADSLYLRELDRRRRIAGEGMAPLPFH